ncbi:MAG TPA: DUF507 family protein [Arcobacter sp.]|nr:DUF507 family protein [Arcobacter sp.]HIP55596.1 DUF507 family protein [Arcobacter sp.]
MKLKKQHANYIARKITNDLISQEFVEVRKEKNLITEVCVNIIDEDIAKEIKLDEHVGELLDKNEDDIEFYNADYRQLFWMTKKRLANDFDVSLNMEDRFSNIAHNIMDYLYEEDFIHFTVSDNQVKNVISNSIDTFIKGYDEADTLAYEKIKTYKRKLIPGTEDYDAVYTRLYEEELIKKGLL